ncbi:protein KRI1 like protein [Ditylenchus destructor]|uniref:Protein KRI1 homolog n=1 Tax=Ditylenchus destructor TaxID=166010 RepID=A0AAD4NHA9_9BILA|nr:protein KRI1 like protein [Ditylenchus destructor]
MNNQTESSTDDESSSSEEPMTWTAEDEKGFLRTLGAIKSRDPKIYSAKTVFYDKATEKPSDEPSTSKQQNGTKTQPIYLRDYERKLVLERGGRISDDDDDVEHEGEDSLHDPSNVEQERMLREEFKMVLNSYDDNDSDCELLCKRMKTEDEKKKEDDDYYEWLKGSGSLDIVDEDLKKLKERWSRKDLDANEAFLRDYLCEKQYVNDDADNQIPTYEEIIQDEEYDKKNDDFEQKFNFRFEEPDQEFIKQFPRTVQESLRQQSTSKRAERRSRLKEKKREKKAELLKWLEESDEEDGETKFKFKYRNVPENDFGLTTEEILKADDKQLNAWVSVHRVSQYRSNEEEDREIRSFKRKAMNTEKKKKIFQSA